MRASSGTNRCYSRALRQDPLAELPGTLGRCLDAAIRRWTFRASSEGIFVKLDLKFQQSPF